MSKLLYLIFISSLAHAESLNFVTIKAGTFTMGFLDDDYASPHEVTLSKDFELQATEMDQATWVRVMNSNPSTFKTAQDCPGEHMKNEHYEACPKFPVENVTWHNLQLFISKLNDLDPSYSYRLPTEAEWEYAERAGSQEDFFFGNDFRLLPLYANTDNVKSSTEPVGSRRPNAWGVFDMQGNVYEWVSDYWSSDYFNQGSVTDPQGPSSGWTRVIRGSCWKSREPFSSSGFRRWGLEQEGWVRQGLGFRLVRTKK